MCLLKTVILEKQSAPKITGIMKYDHFSCLFNLLTLGVPINVIQQTKTYLDVEHIDTSIHIWQTNFSKRS